MHQPVIKTLINSVTPLQRADTMDLEGYNPNTEWNLESASVERLD